MTASQEVVAMRSGTFVWLVCAAAALGAVGCDKGSTTTPPEARPGGRYVVTKETPFFDSGCQQSRPNDGKLKKNTRFTLVSTSGSCWNIKLEDEDETYIQPLNVRAE